MLHVFLVSGSFWFWAFIVASLILEFIFVFREELAGSLTVPVIFTMLLVFFSNVHVSEWSWLGLIYIALTYIGLGIGWALTRWAIYCLKRKAFFYKVKEDWIEETDTASAMDLKKVDLKDWNSGSLREFLEVFATRWNESPYGMRYGSYGYIDYRSTTTLETIFKTIVPQARREKAKITVWLAFWPVSILCYLLGDLFVDFYNFLARSLTHIIQGINNLIFGNMKKEMGIK